MGDFSNEVVKGILASTLPSLRLTTLGEATAMPPKSPYGEGPWGRDLSSLPTERKQTSSFGSRS